MLETRHSSNQTIKPSLAFVPRQVSLLAKRTNMKKNEKTASETLEETELIKDEALNMRSSKKEKKEKKEKKKSKKSKKSKKESSNDLSPLLLSIAAFLKRHGFSKTLAALQCEASIEELDGSKVHKIDLEAYYKYLGTSQYDGNADLNDSEELDFHKDGIAKEKDKKKKKSKSLDAENVDQDSTELLVEKRKENTKHSVSSQGECKDSSIVPLEETDMKSRDSEKKKNKVKSDSFDKDIEGCNSENGIGDIHAEGTHVKSKDKKRKNKLSTESSGGGEEMGKNNFEKESVPTMEETAVSLARTSSKKRKKLASENDELETNGKIRSKETKQGKIEGSQEEKENDNAHSLPESEYAAGKRRKTEKRDVVSIKCKEITPGKQLDGLTNGNIQNNGTVESGTKSGTTKQQKGSAEPKTVNAFQRVKVDGVEFADERLQDNSYWAKDGAETGYGAKAQEVLGQVKGRDFRHEKTKKKRGSYRGGQIDLQTHSIKFQYSDEE